MFLVMYSDFSSELLFAQTLSHTISNNDDLYVLIALNNNIHLCCIMYHSLQICHKDDREVDNHQP